MNICYGNYKRGRIYPYHVSKHCPFRFCPIARPKRNCREFLWLYTSTFQSLITSPFNIFALIIITINISLRLKNWFYMKILCVFDYAAVIWLLSMQCVVTWLTKQMFIVLELLHRNCQWKEQHKLSAKGRICLPSRLGN